MCLEDFGSEAGGEGFILLDFELFFLDFELLKVHFNFS